MKRMQLSEEEVTIIERHRAEKRAAKFDEEERQRRAACEHDYQFDFNNYKTTYYKCSRCGQRKAV